MKKLRFLLGKHDFRTRADSRERIMGHFKENLPQKRIKFFSWQNREQFCNDFFNREASNNFWMSWIILNHLNTHHHVNYCLLLLSLSFLRYKYFTFLPDFSCKLTQSWLKLKPKWNSHFHEIFGFPLFQWRLIIFS